MIAYLLASLPAPRASGPPEIDLAEFVERCRGFVNDDRWHDLADLLEAPSVDRAPTAAALELESKNAVRPDRSRDGVARAWRDLDAQIDDAVANHRAVAARRDPTPFLQRPSGHRVDVAEAVQRAFATADPRQREVALDEVRWRLAADLASSDPDGFAALYARAVQLRIAWRRARWDAAVGWNALEESVRALEAKHA